MEADLSPLIFILEFLVFLRQLTLPVSKVLHLVESRFIINCQSRLTPAEIALVASLLNFGLRSSIKVAKTKKQMTWKPKQVYSNLSLLLSQLSFGLIQLSSKLARFLARPGSVLLLADQPLLLHLSLPNLPLHLAEALRRHLHLL